MQTTYETIFILQPELSEEEVDSSVAAFEQVLKEGRGELRKTEKWGKKRLAYRVKKFWEGFYVFLEHTSPPDTLSELERRLRIHENVLKWMSVRKDPRAEAEEERKAARMARAQKASDRPGEAEAEAPDAGGGGGKPAAAPTVAAGGARAARGPAAQARASEEDDGRSPEEGAEEEGS